MSITINVKIRLSAKGYSWLCFRHAVQLASQGIDIDMDLDEYDSEYYLGSTSCKLCDEELEKEKEEQERQINELLARHAEKKTTIWRPKQ